MKQKNLFFSEVFRQSVLFWMWFILCRSPLSIFLSLFARICFISFQAIAILILIGWLTGEVNFRIAGIFGFRQEGISYPILSGSMMLMASIFGIISRKMAIYTIRKIEIYAVNLDSTSQLTISDLRSFAKIMLALIDTLIPILLLLLTSIAWLWYFPWLTPFLILVAVGLFFLYRAIAKYSEKQIRAPSEKFSNIEYLTSAQRHRFYKILILPHYITLITYFLLASFVVIFSIVLVGINDESARAEIQILSIVTAIATFQLKSLVTVVVRIGAYGESSRKVAKVVSYSGDKSAE